MRQRDGSKVVKIIFEETAFAELYQWEKEDRNVFDKLSRLIIEVSRDPFHGTGKHHY